MTEATFPPQAWGHRQGKINMNLLAPADWSPEALSARAQIAEAFYRFGFAHDEARADVVVSCFTEDCIYEVGLGNAQPFTRFTGRAELFERNTLIVAEQKDQRRHLMSNVMVEKLDLQAGTAQAIAYGAVTVAADGLTVGASTFYTADLVREEDGCWRFAYFFIGIDDYAGNKPKSGEKKPE